MTSPVESLQSTVRGRVSLPGEPGWEWLATPGHSPGHISLFRPSDRVLIAGDAFATMNMDSWSGLVTGRQTLQGTAKGYVSGPRRFTDIFVKRNGRWQCAGGQSTLVPAK